MKKHLFIKKLLVLLVVLITCIPQMWAATETTIYYAVNTEYDVKCNVNRQGDASNFATYAMTKNGKKYNGIDIYSVTFTDLYDGLGRMQLQLYDGETWKSQVCPICADGNCDNNSWTSASTYNGKLWYDGKWRDYTYDVTIYFVPETVFDTWSDNGTDWIRVNFQKETGKDNWGQVSMSRSELQYNGNDIYYADISASNLPYGGVATLQFQRMPSGGSTPSETKGAISPWWGIGNWAGKMYKSSSSWVDLDYSKYTISSGTRIYFDNTVTDWSTDQVGSTDVMLHLIQHNYKGYDTFTHVDGSPYYYRDYPTAWSNFGGAIFYQPGWAEQSVTLHQNISGTVCFTPSGSSPYSLSTTAIVGPKNVGISNTGTTLSGSGTAGDPYIVAPGVAISVSAAGTAIDGTHTVKYKFNSGDYSTTNTYTVTGVGGAVAGLEYSVTAKVKTTYSTSESREFTTTTLHYKTAYAITLNTSSGAGGPGTVYAVNGNTASNIASFPTKSGMGFDGFWTGEGGTGTQVINAYGNWNKNVTNFTDNSGSPKWACTASTTLYARWMDPGYYYVGEISSWTAQSLYKFDGSGDLTISNVSKSAYSGNTPSYTTEFKIRQIVAGAGNTDVWYGYGTDKTYGQIGKNKTETLTSSGNENNVRMEVFYDGDYTLHFNTSTKVVGVTVPVIEEIQIYEPSSQKHSWTGTPGTYQRSVTIALDRGTYEFKAVADSRFFSKTSGSITRASNNVTGLTCTGSEGNLSIDADLKGDYVFLLDTNPSNRQITVTYPTRRQVTYSAVTKEAGIGESADPTAENDDDSDYAITSGGYVANGNSVTFRAANANAGYHFKGWFTKNNPSSWTDGRIATTQEFTISSITKDTTIYAIYSEDTLTVTVTATTGGSITTPSGSGSTVSAHPATKADIVAAKADEGWHFTGWSVESGSATFDDQYALTTKVTTTEDATIQANFVRRYALYGSRDNGAAADTKSGLPGWSPNEPVDFTGSVTTLGTAGGANLTYAATLEPNKKYKFQVYDRALSKYRGATSADAVLPAEGANNWELNEPTSPKDVHIYTVGYGTYTFHITKISNDDNRYPSIQVDRQSSKQLTLGKKVIYNDDNSSLTNADTEGTVTAKVVENEPETRTPTDYFLTSGQYYADGSDITFAAEAATGYEIMGWYSDASCTIPYEHDGSTIIISTNGAKTESTLVLKNCTVAKTVYVKFSEIMTTVEINWSAREDIYDENRGWVKKGGVNQTPGFTVKVGKHTAVTLRIEADSTSHYFGSWTKYRHEDISIDSVGDDYHATMTLHGRGAGSSDPSIYISFPHLEKIYFKNWNEDTKSALWDSVYVGFNPNHDGLGANVWGKSADDVRAMKREGEDNYNYVRGKYDYYSMWWSYVPRHMTRTGNKNVVFFNKGAMRTYDHFAHGNAADRGDYNKKNNMFVPASTKKETKNGDCDYYSNGYWRNYWVSANEKQGYYLQKKTGTNTYEELGEFLATKGTTYTNEFLTEMEYTVRFDNTLAADFRIVSAGGEHYVANANLTSASPESYLKSDNADDHSFRVTPTAEGNYVFKIVQSSDTMDISVDYPVAIGDYVLENTYTDGSTRTARSNIIKASVADTKTRYSMYLSNAGGAATLKLRKCTDISLAGVPTWSTGDATNLGDVLTTVGSTPGVYQFDLTVDKSTNTVSGVDSLRLYSGNYYIKVDAAPGGWAGYTNNVMDKNSLGFDRTKSYTFDNYWCHYYSTGTGHKSNIKCVVANDYCNQLSDTLKQDALNIAWMSGNEPYVPVDGTSIRFSYNSATNTINRSYLAAQDDDYYLDIKVNNSAKVYNESNVDLYTTSFDNTWANRCRFTDTKDWVYEKIVKVIPGGEAGVVAKYQGVDQTFLPVNTTLIGSSEASSTKYTIRLVYDFKTNYMMSAFLLTDETTINENLSDFDMLWVRHKDKSATQLTLGTDKSLTNVRPIAAIEFRYDSVHYSGTGVGHVEMYQWTPQNRPFLKYFVSFPFDVEMNSIFGLNQASYGLYYDYVIQKYNGAKRAKDGLFFGDDNNYWENVEMGDTLHANEGYCVIFDNEYVSGMRGQMWENKTTGGKVYLYFPAMKDVASITNSNTETAVKEHTCTINRSYTTASGKEKNHMITDSHWNLIGNPLFHDAYIKKFVNGGDSTLKSYYYMDLTSIYASQDWQVQTITAGTTQLKAMSSVLVQWFGTINWGTSAGVLAAPRRAAEEKDYLAQLEIKYNGVYADQTFVSLSDDADTDFVLREDMCKIITTARPNIYTFIGNYDVAYNAMPIENCTIPVGVLARRTGTYTFSMPKNFSGTVTLIDKFAQTRTNLNIDDYEVYLNKGTIDDRFELEININQAPTAIDGATDGSGSLKDGKAHKFIMDGMMYILKDGVIYDARGNRVK